MPTYDYQCQACGHAFEVFQSIKARPKRKCPACGRLRLRRLIGAGAGVIFKGSGFYQTDYRSDAYRKSAKADEPGGAAKPDAGQAAKTDTAKSDAPPKADKSAKTDSGQGAAKKP